MGECILGKILKILDWFIIKKYLTTFFFTAFIFTMIAVVIDTSDKLEKFLKEDCRDGDAEYRDESLDWYSVLLKN